MDEALELETKRPWAKYRKAFPPGEDPVRVPEGLSAQYSSYNEYYKFVSQKQNAKEHKKFLASLKDWIRQHNQEPEKTKLRSKEELFQVQRQLAVERKSGGKFIAPRKQFILSSAWKESQHGKWDASKEVQAVIKGQTVKGVWRTVGEEGVFDFEEYEDTALSEQVIEHGLDHPATFSEEAFNRKKQALRTAMSATARQRDSAAVKGPELSLEQLMGLVQSCSSASVGATRAEASRSRSRSRSAPQEDEDSNSDADGQEGPLAGLSMLAPAKTEKAAKAKTAPKHGAKSGSSQAAKDSAPSSHGAPASTRNKKDAAAPAKKAHKDKEQTATPKTAQLSKQKKQKEGADSGPGPLLLDGRAGRTLKRMQDTIADFRHKLESTDLSDGPVRQGNCDKQYKVRCQKRAAELSFVCRAAKDTLKRVSQSTNRAAFEDEEGQLAFLKALNACEEGLKGLGLNIGLGPGFVLKSLMAHANEACLHDDYDGFCCRLCADTAQVQQVLVTLDEAEVRQHFTAEVENRILAALRSITSDELGLKAEGKAKEEDTPNLHEAFRLTGAIAEACCSEGFLANELLESAKLAHSMVDQGDMAALLASVQKIQSHSDAKVEQLDAMTRFFLQHEIGKALLAMATERVDHGEAEAAFQEACGQVSSHVGELTAVLTEAPHKQSRGIQIIEDFVKPAMMALQKLKACEFVQKKSPKRAEQLK
ncbi:unnamed protein product [Effrenium voratum]|nr:unnamed protein product [Effrenium voratum]